MGNKETRAEWLSPFELSEEIGNSAVPNSRASNTGCLPMSFADDLNLLDWTGRQLRADKRGAIPADLAPILERLQVSDEGWMQTRHSCVRRRLDAVWWPQSWFRSHSR